MLLSGLSENKSTIDVATGFEEVDILVRRARELLGPELQAVPGNRYLEGYLMGTLDAVAQRMPIPANECILVVAAAFATLFPAQPGAFGRMLVRSHDADFARGQTAGRSAAMALLDEVTFPPPSLRHATSPVR